MEQALRLVLDWSGTELWNLTERYAAVDAKNFMQEPLKDADIDPIYTLGEQLFVEPQPLALPTRLELNSPIQMSRPEIAIARSHIVGRNRGRRRQDRQFRHSLFVLRGGEARHPEDLPFK
jgi:hypothetical protein